jgi:hypothetical protein
MVFVFSGFWFFKKWIYFYLVLKLWGISCLFDFYNLFILFYFVDFIVIFVKSEKCKRLFTKFWQQNKDQIKLLKWNSIMWDVVIFSNQKNTTRKINSKEDEMGRDSDTHLGNGECAENVRATWKFATVFVKNISFTVLSTHNNLLISKYQQTPH